MSTAPPFAALPAAAGCPDTARVPALALLAVAACLAAALPARADDEAPPPRDPAPVWQGILPLPPLPTGSRIDQSSVPWGVRQVFNAPELRLGQSFTPTRDGMDWIAFVVQNSFQPQWNLPAGAGALQVRLHDGLNRSTGAFGALLATSATVEIASNETRWLQFNFAQTVALTPGRAYFAELRMASGYPSWVGGRLDDVYAGGSAFGYLPNPFNGQFQRLADFDGYDLVFAQGLAPVPEPAPLLLWAAGLLAWQLRRRAAAGSPAPAQRRR